MKKRSDTIRKAAILIASLDRDAADALLNQMSDEQARRLRRALVELGDIDTDEQADVIEEFFRIGPLAPKNFPLASSSATPWPRNWASSRTAARSPRRVRASSPDRRRSSSSTCSRPPSWLGISNASTRKRSRSWFRICRLSAGDVLGRFSPLVQADVARRLVDLDPRSPR